MINDFAHQAVSTATLASNGSLRRPLYDSYCFARLPATLEFLLTGDAAAGARGLPADVLGPHARRWDRVVLLLVDGFGWHLVQQYASRFPFLGRLLEQGLASPITAQFPSTTAAHMTTLHTGRPVSQTGVWEWYYYEPLAGTVITPLLWSAAGDRTRESLKGMGLDPQRVLPGPRWYRALADQGVPASVYQDEKYARSTYSTTMFAGATSREYASVPDGLTRLGDELLASPHERRYCFFYIDGIDGKSHSHGLASPEFEGQVEETFRWLEELIWQRLAGKVGDTLLVMSADHGQVPVDVHEPIYVNRVLPELLPLLRSGPQGVIRFGGSARDFFLYLRDGCLDEAEALLRQRLAGAAEVWRTEKLLAEGLFGPPPEDRLRERLGDLAVLPHAGQAVFWLEEGMFVMKHRGSHGGLTPLEMDTGVYLIPL